MLCHVRLSSLVVRNPAVVMHLQTLFEQCRQLVLATTLHEHIPMRAGRLGDFVRLLVLLVLTVRGGAAMLRTGLWALS